MKSFKRAKRHLKKQLDFIVSLSERLFGKCSVKNEAREERMSDSDAENSTNASKAKLSNDAWSAKQDVLSLQASIIKRASIIALVGNVFICLAKLTVAYFTSSLSILGDAIDSGADVGIAIMALVVSFIIKMPQSKKYPYGRGRAETLASLILSLAIMIMGLQLFITAGKKILFPSMNIVGVLLDEMNFQSQLASIIVIIASIVLKFLLALNQFFLAKKAKSTMILANALNMKNDIILSSSVLIGLSCTYYFHIAKLDSIVALLISLYIMKGGLSLFCELNIELMDGNTNNRLYKKLFDTIALMPNVHNPHRARIRKMANLFEITVDIELACNTTVLEAHNIAEELTCKIKQRIENVYDVVIHIEPYDVLHNEQEGFGLKPIDVDEITVD